jgi:hypothetical protein
MKLKKNTRPTENFIAMKVHNLYTKAMKELGKTIKINQWVDKWEHAIKLIEKYNLPWASNRLWLHNLAQVIKPLSVIM